MWEKDYITKRHTHRLDAKEIAVRIGDHNRKSAGEEKLPAAFVNVKEIHYHPNYFQERDGIDDPPTFGYLLGFDVAILELERELDLTIYTPVCLPNPSDKHSWDGKSARAAGWGNIGPYPIVNYPDVPYEVDLTVMAHNDQRCAFDNGTMFKPVQMCSGIEKPNTGACHVRSPSERLFKYLFYRIFFPEVLARITF